MGVKVVWLHIPHVAHGVDEALRQIHGDGHGTPIVAEEEAKGTPLAGVTPSLKSIARHLEFDLYILNKVQDLVQSIQVGLDPVDHKPHIDICDPFMSAICLEDKEDGSSPAELGGLSDGRGMNVPSVMSFHRWSREIHCMQRVHLMGQKRMSPRLSLS